MTNHLGILAKYWQPGHVMTRLAGYYLVGARDRVPPIFADIPWGTREVFAATAARLDQCGCRYERLQSWYDVDRMDDLRQLDHDLNQLPTSEDRLAALRETVADVLRTTT